MVSRETGEAWLRLPSREELRRIFPTRHPYEFGFLPSMGRLVAAHPEIGPLFGLLFNRIMFGPGSLERREREMVAAVAAAAQDCFY